MANHGEEMEEPSFPGTHPECPPFKSVPDTQCFYLPVQSAQDPTFSELFLGIRSELNHHVLFYFW